MPLGSKRLDLLWVFVLAIALAWQPASAQNDVTHAVSGIVKSID